MGDSLVMEKQGQKCEGNMREIGYGFLYVNAVKGYVPENDIVTAYSSGCQMNFEGNQFIINSYFDAATNTFYEMYDDDNANAKGVGSWFYFDATQLYQRSAYGTTATLGYTYDPVTGVLSINSGADIFQVTYDKFFENIYFTDEDGNVFTLGFYGEKTLNGCSEVVVLADKPCLGPTEVQSILNKASKNCDCNCEDYVNSEPTSKRGESLYLSDAEFNCIDGVVYMTITFHYSGSPVPNSFGVYVNGGIVYTFANTGSSGSSFISTVTSSDIASLPQNTSYDVTIYDNYGTTFGYASNTLESIPLNACVAPEVCCEVCYLPGGQFFVTGMNINGTDYNLLSPPPAPFTAYMGSYITFLEDNAYTWPPLIPDTEGKYTFDCTSNVAILRGLDPRKDIFYLSIDFNCSANAATAYIVLYDGEGNAVPVILTLQVSQDFTKNCTGECCNITSLSGLTLEQIGEFILSGNNSYNPNPATIIKLEFISASSVVIYYDGTPNSTVDYTYDPVTGVLYIDSQPDPFLGLIQLTCNCSKFIFTYYSELNTGFTNIYFQLI